MTQQMQSSNSTGAGAFNPRIWENTIPQQVQLFLKENHEHLERWAGPDKRELEYRIENKREMGAVFPNNFVILRIDGAIVQKLYLGSTPAQLDECVMSPECSLGADLLGKPKNYMTEAVYRKKKSEVEVLDVRPALDLQMDEYLREWLFLNPVFYDKTIIPMTQRFYNKTFDKVYHEMLQEPDELHTQFLLRESEKVTYNLISPPKFPGRLVLGSLVTFHPTGYPQYKVSQILDTLDSEYSLNLKSPLGGALLGARKGEVRQYRDAGQMVSITVDSVDCNEKAKAYIRNSRYQTR